MKDMLKNMTETDRRGFVANAAKAFLGVGVMQAVGGKAVAEEVVSAPAGGGQAENIIYLFMNGGMSHLDTWDTKPGVEQQGPTETISTNVDGVTVSEHLPKMAKQMDKACVINSMTSKQGAHERARYFMRTSFAPLATIIHPAMGAWMSQEKGRQNPALPSNVLINGEARHPGAGYLNAKYSPLTIGNPASGLQNSRMAKGVDNDQFNRRLELSNQFDKSFRARYKQRDVNAYTDFYRDAVRMMKSKDLTAFDISKEDKATKDRYGNGRFGQGVLLARRLVEHGVRYVEVNYGSWDTHQNNFDTVPTRAGELDAALSSLLQDLSDRGLLETTLVVLTTEFGRTPKINDRVGRDHHPAAFSCLLAGGGVRGGQAYGKTDETGQNVIDKPMGVTELNASICYAAGLPYEKEFISPSGRPFTIPDHAQPNLELF
ncbi:MAG: DUF1501 domain-containing protein [Planctomycetota bacterium]|jgi:hypothetical protein